MTSLISTIPPTSSYLTTKSLTLPQNQRVNDDAETKILDKKTENKVKAASIAGSVITTLAFLFALAKNAQKGNFKATDMFKIDWGNPVKLISLATSSVIGGLSGGLIFDKKENRKPKLKEAVHQFFGNIITPITILGILNGYINKKNYSKLTSGILSVISVFIGVGGGVTFGNYVASKVNNKIFREKDDRKIGIKDFGIHIDDILSTAALNETLKKPIESLLGFALPAIFLICGYEAGTKNTESNKK